LAYIVPIVDHVLRRGRGQGIQAIVVYPMNALANSQKEELGKFLERGYGKGQSPVTFARYTGQEKGPEREAIRSNPPDILLTNYMMLELLLTRHEDRALVRAAQGLKYLVFDELHTYRGRQGADIALLIRRCRLAFGGADMVCVGTSATMASGGSLVEQRRQVAEVAHTLFGTPVGPDQVIEETLERATPEPDTSARAILALAQALDDPAPVPSDFETFRTHVLSSWIETIFGIDVDGETRRFVRQSPKPLSGRNSAAAILAGLTKVEVSRCEQRLREFLLRGSELRRGDSSRFPIFAFRLHQFFTRGDTVWATIESEAERHLELSKLGAKPGDVSKT
jgi:ATP-dependent helicase YprA (DUF1998 family)